MTRFALPTTLALIVSATCAPSAIAGPPAKYAVVTVWNSTTDLTLNFDYRWGNEPWKSVKELKAGKGLWFSIELDAKGNAPVFQVRLNRAIGKAKPLVKTWDLDWKKSAKQGSEFGKAYNIRRDLLEPREYVWLFEGAK